MKLDPKDLVIIAGLIGTIVTQVSTCRQKEIELQMMKKSINSTDSKIDSIVENMMEK